MLAYCAVHIVAACKCAVIANDVLVVISAISNIEFHDFMTRIGHVLLKYELDPDVFRIVGVIGDKILHLDFYYFLCPR